MSENDSFGSGSQQDQGNQYVPDWQVSSQPDQQAAAQPAAAPAQPASAQAGQQAPSQTYQQSSAAPAGQHAAAGQPSAAAGQSAAAQPTATYEVPTGAYQQAPAGAYQQSTAASQQQSASYQQNGGASYQQPAAGYAQATTSTGYAQVSGSAPAPVPPAPKKDRSTLKTFFVGFAGAALATIIFLAGWGILNPGQSGGISNGASTSTTFTVQGEDITLAEAVAAKDLPSVVCIYVTGTVSDGWGMHQSSSEQVISLGSGVVLSEDGYILTNYHVIEGGSSFCVSFGNGETCDAKVVGTDESSDLAVIKVDKNGLTPMEIGTSADLVVGEWVMALGAPYGMEQSVSTGIISALSRSSESLQLSDSSAVYANMIQTDAAINPGNSGGALVDSDGKLIGINTMIASNSESSAGVGFAIPIDYAYSIAQQIISGEDPSHAQLGVTLVTINSAMAEQYGFDVDAGAYVNSVVEKSAADKAGIQEGDIIVKIDGKDVTSSSSVILNVRSHKPGDKISIELVRDGKTQTVDVTLGSDQ